MISTNSCKRLVPGFEAPVKLAYSARNRSASIRIPWISNPKGRRIEDPYFAFASMLLAGLDGIQNKIHPGDPADKDRGFLKAGGVFTDDLIDAYIPENEGSDARAHDHPSH